MLLRAITVFDEGLGKGVGEGGMRVCWMEVGGVVYFVWLWRNAFAEEFYEGGTVLG
jgi:hypothetical protein